MFHYNCRKGTRVVFPSSSHIRAFDVAWLCRVGRVAHRTNNWQCRYRAAVYVTSEPFSADFDPAAIALRGLVCDWSVDLPTVVCYSGAIRCCMFVSVNSAWPNSFEMAWNVSAKTFIGSCWAKTASALRLSAADLVLCSHFYRGTRWR